MIDKWRCDECGWEGKSDDLLRATNPFDVGDTITGCQKCKTIGAFTEMCDENGCSKPAGCGWPSSEGYRRTCFEHWRK